MRLPGINPAPAGSDTAGYTTADGLVFLQPGLSRELQVRALEHEGVHVFLTPKSGPFVGARQWASQFGYNNSAFLQASEEIMAESYASGSLTDGILHAFNGKYRVRGVTAVTPGLYLVETTGIATTIGGATYGAHRLGRKIWHQKP
jgi:hypothetical protein